MVVAADGDTLALSAGPRPAAPSCLDGRSGSRLPRPSALARRLAADRDPSHPPHPAPTQPRRRCDHCRTLVDRVWRCAFTWVCGDCYTRLAGDTDGPDVNDERPYLDYDEGYDGRDEDEGDDE